MNIHTPLNHLSIIIIIGPRINKNGTRMGKPTQNNAPYLFNSKGRCERKLKDLATEESLRNNKPVLKTFKK